MNVLARRYSCHGFGPGHVLTLHALDRQSRVYNLGNGQGFSVRDMIETTRRITGKPTPREIGPRRPGDSPALVASSEKIRRELGWKPKFAELEQIVETAWNWHRTHPNGYADRGERMGTPLVCAGVSDGL